MLPVLITTVLETNTKLAGGNGARPASGCFPAAAVNSVCAIAFSSIQFAECPAGSIYMTVEYLIGAVRTCDEFKLLIVFFICVLLRWEGECEFTS